MRATALLAGAEPTRSLAGTWARTLLLPDARPVAHLAFRISPRSARRVACGCGSGSCTCRRPPLGCGLADDGASIRGGSRAYRGSRSLTTYLPKAIRLVVRWKHSYVAPVSRWLFGGLGRRREQRRLPGARAADGYARIQVSVAERAR